MTLRSPSLILASQSIARRVMLKNAGLSFESIPAALDEAFFQRQNIKAADIALNLAKKKALVVAENYQDNLVIGSDQVLEFEGQIVSKSKTEKEAKERLKSFRGKTHELISAVSVVKAGTVLWTTCDRAQLTMHNFDEAFLDRYCEKAGEVLTNCVGSYALESHGSWLFSSVKGDYFTILGLPLLQLLSYLREYHGIRP